MAWRSTVRSWVASVWALTGFGSYVDPDGKRHRGKTLWDLLDLVIIPVALAGGVWVLSDQRAVIDREIAADRDREEALQSYLERMEDLVLTRGLRESGEGAEVRHMARTWTLTTLRRLDGDRKGVVLAFLADSGLIALSDDLPDLDLTNADFSGLILETAELSNINLTGVNLSSARLGRGANLSDANLSGSSFQNATVGPAADLSGAILRDTDLSHSDLWGVNLTGATLESTTFNYAVMGHADVSNTRLLEVGLNEATLTGADFRGTRFIAVHLLKADLSEADLSGAFLDYISIVPQGSSEESGRFQTAMDDALLTDAVMVNVDFHGVGGLTQAQLDSTASYANARSLPDGLRPDSRQYSTSQP